MIITPNIDGINKEFEQTKTGWERGELMER